MPTASPFTHAISRSHLELHCLQVPGALEKLFASNYDLLLSIFNPEGWLDISYVDDTHRVGRDDKGNVFYLERC